jgi:hypothetical protein
VDHLYVVDIAAARADNDSECHLDHERGGARPSCIDNFHDGDDHLIAPA